VNIRNLWIPFKTGCFVINRVTGSFSRFSVLCEISFNWTAFNSVSENRLYIPNLVQEMENACRHSHIIAINCDI